MEIYLYLICERLQFLETLPLSRIDINTLSYERMWHLEKLSVEERSVSWFPFGNIVNLVYFLDLLQNTFLTYCKKFSLQITFNSEHVKVHSKI